MKRKYITPAIEVVHLLTNDNIAQFVVSSKSVGENEGLAKPESSDFEEEEKEKNTTVKYNPWED